MRRHPQREPEDIVLQRAHHNFNRVGITVLSARHCGGEHRRVRYRTRSPHNGHSTSNTAFNTFNSCDTACTFFSKTSSGIAESWNCVKTTSLPVPLGRKIGRAHV